MSLDFLRARGQDASASEDLVRQLMGRQGGWIGCPCSLGLAGSAAPRHFGPSSEPTVSAKGWRSCGELSEWLGRVEYVLKAADCLQHLYGVIGLVTERGRGPVVVAASRHPVIN